jgi:hypothetical protein
MIVGKMGRDDRSVVDGDLNTMAPCTVIGERPAKSSRPTMTL